jgi:hypothetical protein
MQEPKVVRFSHSKMQSYKEVTPGNNVITQCSKNSVHTFLQTKESFSLNQAPEEYANGLVQFINQSNVA